ncbi:GlcNAc-PI de-N-acetylase [Microbacterium sp. cf046]|uniref:PIG-L family deacetylase n=1 Tax=Microbacterium sp. cf046 TaxID=1761803 RepID=UPI0008EAFED3|nr:PIG-L family deacetylase [Microbacterium sp. cf046]SFR86265.1 GlcNAc-PI de-N-acetylase [Microbacterium sp. cf046]
MLCASVVALALTLGGCAGPETPGASTSSPPGTATPAPTPDGTETPSRNDLTSDEIISVAGTCGGLTTVDPAAAPGLPLRDLSQWAADAMMFFASTAQCGEIPAVVARDAARTDPDGTVFASPLQLIEPACPGGTVVSFWAHYDDDLIFANPALQDAFDSGQCLRTFYFTISDAGEGDSVYASNREVGIRAAYDALRGESSNWVDRSVLLRSGLTVTLTRPEGDDRISLLFLRLPDGGLNGGGYPRTGYESLPQLVTGEEPVIHTVDTGQEVTLDQLHNTVVELVNGYLAARVFASLPGFAEGADGDHPDHRSGGRIVAAPVDAGLINADIVQYATGYPVAGLPVNLSGDPLARKLNVFAIYASHDPVIHCGDSGGCLRVRNFGAWLQRQYLVAHNDLVRVSD